MGRMPAVAWSRLGGRSFRGEGGFFDVWTVARSCCDQRRAGFRHCCCARSGSICSASSAWSRLAGFALLCLLKFARFVFFTSSSSSSFAAQPPSFSLTRPRALALLSLFSGSRAAAQGTISDNTTPSQPLMHHGTEASDKTAEAKFNRSC